jgi:hypothetical protein
MATAPPTSLAPVPSAPSNLDRADVLELMADVEVMAPEETSLAREAWAKYGDDVERRIADLAAGRHPFQRPR